MLRYNPALKQWSGYITICFLGFSLFQIHRNTQLFNNITLSNNVNKICTDINICHQFFISHSFPHIGDFSTTVFKNKINYKEERRHCWKKRPSEPTKQQPQFQEMLDNSLYSRWPPSKHHCRPDFCFCRHQPLAFLSTEFWKGSISFMILLNKYHW